MTRQPMHKRRNQRGALLVEVVIWGVITASIVSLFSLSVNDAARFASNSIGGADIGERGRRALDRITRDLSIAGWTTRVVPVTLPHVFTNGDPGTSLGGGFRHDQEFITNLSESFPVPPPVYVPANPPPFVAPGHETQPMGIREIVFAIPTDADGDGRPVSATHEQIEWNLDLVGYIVTPNNAGSLSLVRRVWRDTGEIEEEILTDEVKAITFDTNVSKPVLPEDAVEIHLHLERLPRPGGLPRKIHLFTTVYMRNSEVVTP